MSDLIWMIIIFCVVTIILALILDSHIFQLHGSVDVYLEFEKEGDEDGDSL